MRYYSVLSFSVYIHSLPCILLRTFSSPPFSLPFLSLFRPFPLFLFICCSCSSLPLPSPIFLSSLSLPSSLLQLPSLSLCSSSSLPPYQHGAGLHNKLRPSSPALSTPPRSKNTAAAHHAANEDIKGSTQAITRKKTACPLLVLGAHGQVHSSCVSLLYKY